ncbi:MAG: DUF1549 domain-containing protein [Planctomycetota bacterium]
MGDSTRHRGCDWIHCRVGRPGLPPPYEAVERFAADPSDEAFTTIVDQLLARREYGERWGCHWRDDRPAGPPAAPFSTSGQIRHPNPSQWRSVSNGHV